MFDLSKLKFKPGFGSGFEPPASESSIHELEKIYGHSLPENYKKILKQYHGGSPEAFLLEVNFPNDDFPSEMEVMRFFILNDNKENPSNVWFHINLYSEFLGNKIVPLAEDWRHNFYYLKYENNVNQVWYFSHMEVDEIKNFLVSEAFDQFLNSLYSEN